MRPRWLPVQAAVMPGPAMAATAAAAPAAPPPARPSTTRCPTATQRATRPSLGRGCRPAAGVAAPPTALGLSLLAVGAAGPPWSAASGCGHASSHAGRWRPLAPRRLTLACTALKAKRLVPPCKPTRCEAAGFSAAVPCPPPPLAPLAVAPLAVAAAGVASSAGTRTPSASTGPPLPAAPLVAALCPLLPCGLRLQLLCWMQRTPTCPPRALPLCLAPRAAATPEARVRARGNTRNNRTQPHTHTRPLFSPPFHIFPFLRRHGPPSTSRVASLQHAFLVLCCA